MSEASRDQRRGVTAPERYVTPSHELSVSQIFLSCLQLSVTDLTHATDATQHSPYVEANNSSASQAIPRFVLNLKFCYRVHKRPSLVPVVSHIIPLHILLAYFVMIRFNNILPSMPRCC